MLVPYSEKMARRCKDPEIVRRKWIYSECENSDTTVGITCFQWTGDKWKRKEGSSGKERILHVVEWKFAQTLFQIVANGFLIYSTIDPVNL